MGFEATGAARWSDIFRSRGELPVGRERHHSIALFRLAIAVPLAVGPTQLWLRNALETAHAPEWGAFAVKVHLAFLLLYVATILASVWLSRRGAPERPALWMTLSMVCCLCELGTNQAYLIGFGCLANYSICFIPVLILMYRFLLGYRAGLWTLAMGVTAYVGCAILEVSGEVPAAPLLSQATDHPAWIDPSLTASVILSVTSICITTFMMANYGMNQSVRLHQYITDSVLHRYLPPDLVDRAARGELQLDAPPQRQILTVMFTDVVGFTSLTERLGPEAIGSLLNRYLGEIADVAHEHGATVDKFIGDCVMVNFGAPQPMPPEEQARRCVVLAQAVHQRVRDLGLDHPLQARTGINTGEVVVGNFGSHARSDYTALGPAVNVAARLESASAPGRILIGAETARYLGDAFDLEPAGELQLKGVAQPVSAYFVAGESAGTDLVGDSQDDGAESRGGAVELQRRRRVDTP